MKCIKCVRPAKPGRVRCAYHLDYVSQWMREYRKKLLADRRCPRCTVPLREDVDEGNRTCVNCRELRH